MLCFFLSDPSVGRFCASSVQRCDNDGVSLMFPIQTPPPKKPPDLLKLDNQSKCALSVTSTDGEKKKQKNPQKTNKRNQTSSSLQTSTIKWKRVGEEQRVTFGCANICCIFPHGAVVANFPGEVTYSREAKILPHLLQRADWRIRFNKDDLAERRSEAKRSLIQSAWRICLSFICAIQQGVSSQSASK